MARPKGSLNKRSILAKEAFQKAFDDLGGTDTLATWAKANLGEFYKIYGRLIPNDVNANLTGAVRVDGTINFIRPNHRV